MKQKTNLINPEILIYFIINVENSILNFLVDLFGRPDEGLLYVGRCFRRRLHEYKPMFAGERLTFFFFDLSSRFQVTLQTGLYH